MPNIGPFMLISLVFFFLAAISALVARSAARQARSILRDVRSDIASIDREVTLHGASIKKLHASVGALGRWQGKKPGSNPNNPDELPDPTENPEAWRAAVRRMGLHQSLKPKGDLQ